MNAQSPRVVVVTRPTEYESLLARHGTKDQARFFLETRQQSLEEVERRHQAAQQSSLQLSGAIPVSWRRTRVDRADLSRFVFEPEDIVCALGQDGLVANVAKYLCGQPVLGFNVDPSRNPGVLVRHAPAAAKRLLQRVSRGEARFEPRAMVEAVLDDGQRLLALNEIFVGHRSHQSARYRLKWKGSEERQSSSGLIVTTGTGSTGWARSILRNRKCELPPPDAVSPLLAFLVREAWPSTAFGTSLTDGLLAPENTLELVSEMEDGGVAFGDGMEDDPLTLGWGTRLVLRLAEQRLRLVVG